MKKIILCLKGILLYTTIIATMLFVGGIDSLFDNGWLIEAGLFVAGLIYACYKFITEEEFDSLCFTHINKSGDI